MKLTLRLLPFGAGETLVVMGTIESVVAAVFISVATLFIVKAIWLTVGFCPINVAVPDVSLKPINFYSKSILRYIPFEGCEMLVEIGAIKVVVATLFMSVASLCIADEGWLKSVGFCPINVVVIDVSLISP